MNSANTMSISRSANWLDARWTLAPRIWIGYAAAVIVRFKSLAPYALIELVLPGGSVMALLLWLYRRRKKEVGFGQFRLALVANAITRWRRPFLTGRVSFWPHRDQQRAALIVADTSQTRFQMFAS